MLKENVNYNKRNNHSQKGCVPQRARVSEAVGRDRAEWKPCRVAS